MDLHALLTMTKTAAVAAGEAILQFYSPDGFHEFDQKADSSPVTVADLAAHKIIKAQLEQTPYPLLSEEGNIPDYATRKQWPLYWLIDPLDGTKEFLAGSGDFTVNIALIQAGVAILGVIYAPTTRTLYFAAEKIGAFRQIADDITRLKTRPWSNTLTTIAVSRRHGVGKRMQLLLEHFQANIGAYDIISAGSSLKLCYVAEGKADLYPRLSPTSEWDTAAGQAILEIAGGQLINREGEPIRYNQKASLENPAFSAMGDPQFPWQVIHAQNLVI